MTHSQQFLLDAALERAAAQLGDITPPVTRAFFARFPDAEAAFAHHQPDNPQRLMAEMVDNALYCIMTWLERRAEVEIILGTSVPHHADTLQVPTAWYAGLIEATLDTLAETCPPGAVDEAAMWNDLRIALAATVARA